MFEGVWLVFVSAEIKKYCSACNAKRKGDRIKNLLILADTCKQIVENQYGRCGLSHLLESLPKELYIIGPTLLL